MTRHVRKSDELCFKKYDVIDAWDAKKSCVSVLSCWFVVEMSLAWCCKIQPVFSCISQKAKDVVVMLSKRLCVMYACARVRYENIDVSCLGESRENVVR